MSNDGSNERGNEPPSERLPSRRMFEMGATNPFSDEHSNPNTNPQPPLSENFYAGPAGPFSTTSPDKLYANVLPHRGTAVLSLGLVGFLGATIGSLGLFCCLPFPLFALALTIPAWLMGRMDLKAMHAGAMDTNGKSSTRAGHILGMLGTVVGVTVSLGIVGFWLRAILSGQF